MTIIVFLLDTSASMAQKSYVGVTYLEFARQFVESFLKMRQRDASSKTDRYMLMNYDEFPRNVKAGWKENQTQFNEQLRNLRPTGRGQFSEALFNAIRFVNLNRVQSGIENYGYGRYPSYSEPVVFISIIDANSDSSRKNFLQNSKFPKLPALGSDLTDEPFRWDHRLFVVFLNLPGHPYQRVSHLRPPSGERRQVEMIVDKMNGRFFDLNSHKNTNMIIDGILQRMQQNGVFIKFERHELGPAGSSVQPLEGEDTSAWKSQTILINRIPKGSTGGSQSSWPIPEAFWPDSSMMTLPARKVYPELVFICSPVEPVSMTNVAMDKYELEPCKLTQALIDRRDPNACWQVFVINSHKQSNSIGYPFGYLKLSSNMQTVNLFIFPYNYSTLFAIIEESKDSRICKTPEFKNKVDRYFQNLPPYYISPLRKALVKIPIPHQLLDDRYMIPPFYHPSWVTQYKKWREMGKEEMENICQQIAAYINPQNPDASRVFNIVCGVYQLPMVEVVQHSHIDPNKPTKIGVLQNYQPRPPLFKDQKIAVSTTRYPKNPSSKFRNPYDIDREELVDQLEKMRVNLDLQIKNSSIAALEGGLPGQRIRLQHAEDLHSLPVTKMGDYQEYTKRLNDIGKAPLREIEPQVAKAHAFGNPFKLDKKSMSVDEVGEMPMGNTVANGNSGAASPTQNGMRNNEIKMRQWKRRCSMSRENSPVPEDEEPALKKPHIDTDNTKTTESTSSTNVVIPDSPTATDIPPSVINNVDIKKPQKSNDRATKDPRLLTSEKNKCNGQNPNDNLTSIESTSNDDHIQMLLGQSPKEPEQKGANSKKRRSVPKSSSSSASSSSDETIKSNGSGSVFGDSELPKNVDFRRRAYPSSALAEAEDPPTLSKEELIRRKFYLIRAIRHRDKSTKYDPGKECVRLVNELSWREQFECLEYAHEQAKKFGLGTVANWLNGELKRVAKCIRVTTRVNGTNV